MKYFLLLLISFPLYAQLERPILEGKCKKPKVDVAFTLMSDSFRVIVKDKGVLKTCNLEIVNSSSSGRRPVSKETLYFVPESCNGKFSSEPGFSRGPVIERGFLEVSKMGKTSRAAFNIFTEGEILSCDVKVSDWEKLHELSDLRRKN